MKVSEIRDLAREDLVAQIAETRKEIVELRFQLAARKLEKPHKLREARKRLSRLLTVESEQKRQASARVKAGE